MTKINLTGAGKRFNKDWIFKNLDFTFEQGKQYALVGNNGSGKSTLLQIIAGYTTLSKGTITWEPFVAENIFQQVSIVAPYLELLEELTTKEQIQFHNQFKPLRTDLSMEQMLDFIGLQEAIHKQIRFFSSGMKQRLKLALAFFSETPILLLDEPCSNLDQEGFTLYHQLVQQFGSERLIIVGSNDKQEYHFCTEQVNLMNYKS